MAPLPPQRRTLRTSGVSLAPPCEGMPVPSPTSPPGGSVDCSPGSGEPQAAPAAGLRIGVRVRPLLPREAGQREGVRVRDRRVTLCDDRGQEKTFGADAVLDSRWPSASTEASAAPPATQNCVFEALGAELVRHALAGYHSCLLAYGHTGSGKTYTVLGEEWSSGATPSSPGRGIVSLPSGNEPLGAGVGLLPRALEGVFNALSQDSSTACIASFYEIHNERIRDLIAPAPARESFGGSVSSQSRRPTVHFHPRFGSFVSDITEVRCETLSDAVRLVMIGTNNRTTAPTALNERSSRSHAIFMLRIERASTGNCLMIADLAGREQERLTQCRSERFIELTRINRSLFHLSRCVRALAQGQQSSQSTPAPCNNSSATGGGGASSSTSGANPQSHHFRNSKLTMVLGHALSGNSHTAVVGTISPARNAYEDSLATLRFCESMKAVRIRPHLPRMKREDVVHELQDEVRRLEQELARACSGRTLVERQLAEAQAMIDHYRYSCQEVLNRSNQEIVRLREEATQAKTICMTTPCPGSPVSPRRPPVPPLALMTVRSPPLATTSFDGRVGVSNIMPATPTPTNRRLGEGGTGGFPAAESPAHSHVDSTGGGSFFSHAGKVDCANVVYAMSPSCGISPRDDWEGFRRGSAGGTSTTASEESTPRATLGSQSGSGLLDFFFRSIAPDRRGVDAHH